MFAGPHVCVDNLLNSL